MFKGADLSFRSLFTRLSSLSFGSVVSSSQIPVCMSFVSSLLFVPWAKRSYSLSFTIRTRFRNPRKGRPGKGDDTLLTHSNKKDNTK